MFRSSFFFILISLVFFTSLGLAGIPKLINYQGMLTDNSGTPLSGSYTIIFRIYDDPSAGTKKWEETQTGVSVTNGLFNVILGSVTPINLDFSEDYWLDITLDGETMPSRLKFTSVGYAFRAQWADTASVAVLDGGGWTDDGTNVRLTTSSDKVGIGIATPDRILDVNGQISLRPGAMSNAGIYLKTPAGADEWFMGKANIGGKNQFGFYKDDWRFVIEDNGNVGIGTEYPKAKLTVNDTISNFVPGVPGIMIGNPSGGDAFVWMGKDGNHMLAIGWQYAGWAYIGCLGHQPLVLQPSGGCVGIGITNPASKLNVSGYEQDYHGKNASICISNTAPNGRNWYLRVGATGTATPAGGLSIADDVGYKMFIDSSGNVSIGPTAPGYKLDVSGAAHATSFPTSSDARLKKNVTQLTNSLEKLGKIRGVLFDWNEKYESMGRSTGHREIGVIAQEVETVFPELVSTWGEEEYRAVDYGRLTGVLIEAIKELKAENEGLKKRIEVLEAR